MKKILAMGLLSLSALAVFCQPASALFHPFFHCGHCWYRCSMTICCRQDKAFTPTCFGTISCSVCCPVNCGPQPYAPPVAGPFVGGDFGGDFGGGCCAAGPRDFVLPPGVSGSPGYAAAPGILPNAPGVLPNAPAQTVVPDLPRGNPGTVPTGMPTAPNTSYLWNNNPNV